MIRLYVLVVFLDSDLNGMPGLILDIAHSLSLRTGLSTGTSITEAPSGSTTSAPSSC